MHTNTFKIAMGLALMFTGITAEAGNSWKIIKNKNGITVSQKRGERNELLSKVEMNTVHSVAEVVACITDFRNYRCWNSNCTQSRLIKKISDTSWVYYSVYAAPFITDRELYAKVVKHTKSDGSIHITITACPDIAAPNSQFIRILKFQCEYILQPDATGGTNITSLSSLDMSGSLPASLVDRMSAGTLYDTYKQLGRTLGESQLASR